LATVIIQISVNVGICDFCQLEDTPIVSPEELNDRFQPLLDLYELTNDGGESIVNLLKKDWILFTSLDNEKATELLESIVELELHGLFTSKENENEVRISNWKDFKTELKHDNRYFPKKAPDYGHLNELLAHIILPHSDIPKYLYRSRVNIDTEIIDIEKMGKPPAKIATAGRANPIGIPYIYAASNIKTAIAEIRPHKGDNITVATFEIKEALILADLRKPRESVSPFGLDEDGVNQIFRDLDYLCHLGDELSKPILPREAHLEYLSSQYLCELIKHCGYDGVIYKSSVGDGDNYAIFSDNKIEATTTEVHIIDNINIISSLH
jgi:RES domain-containing protein